MAEFKTLKYFIILCLWTVSEIATADIFGYPENNFHLKTGYVIPAYNIEFQSQSSEEILGYLPNIQGLASIEASYKGDYGIGWAFSLGQSNSKNLQRGKTSSFDWRFYYAAREFVAGFHYSQFRGFFINNSQDVDPNWLDGDPYIQLPDMYLRTAGLHFTWVWRPKTFSMPALLNQTERQDKTGGSWLVGGNIGDTTVENEGGIIPNSLGSSFGSGYELQRGQFLVFQAKGGYGWTWVRNGWFVGGYGLLGLGAYRRKSQNSSGARSQGYEVTYRVDILMTGGFNGDDFFGGTTLIYNQENFSAENMRIRSTHGSLMLFVGVHL